MMVVITLTNCPAKVRGDLTKWMIEIDCGVFVGNMNPRIRDLVWQRICQNIKNGRASMAFSTNNEQKLDFRIHNTEWEPVDYDGIKLIRIKNTKSENDKKEMSKADIRHKMRMEQRKASSKMQPEKYVVLDIETTGIKETDSIIEIAALLIENGEISDEFHEYVDSGVKIPEAIINLTGITDDVISQKGIPLKEALEKLKEFTGRNTIVGHNIIFDIDFLHRACKSCGLKPIINMTVDTIQISRKKLDDISSFKLGSVAKALEIEVKNEHQAYYDCLTTYRIYEKLKKI